jgi:mannose-6-phosphate isomerase-like protein (cupin superfamily)
VRVSAESGAELYVISFGMSVPEAAYLERLQSQHEGFFRSLEGDYRDEWDAVKDKPLDYVAAGERNAERMRRGMEGILVAPPDSRFTHPRSNGWHFMFTRGSRTLGFGSDVLYKLRSEEVSHSHRIIDEIYVGLGGGMSFEVDGREVHVGKGSVLISPPGERHKMRRLVEAPYYGFTLQTPSIPSDRILE